MTLTRFQSKGTEGADEARAGSSTAPAVHLVTFGCQMNKYDSLLVEGRFTRRGYRVAGSLDEADVVLFNTCSVRDHAEERVYSWVGELKRAKEANPELVIGIMGCMAQRAGDDIVRRAGHVDLVCGTRQLQHLPDMVEELFERRAEAAGTARVASLDMDTEVAVERAGEPYTGGLSGYLAAMRGCDLNCTFCIVPRTRGRVQSRPIEALVDEARWMVSGGARVVTLLGQTVNSYGEDLPKPGPGAPKMRGRQGRPSLADLLYALQEVDGLARIRLITLHPSYVTPALAEAIRDCPKVERFLPLPVQSGSDDVLRRMKRGYTTDLYRRRVDILREAVPDLELGTDWIVGFPGETDADFERTLDFAAEIGFSQGYVFKYDPRPETAAHAFDDDVARDVKKARNQALLRRVEEVGLGRMERWLGREVEVFVDEVSPRREGFVTGRTAHSLPIQLPGDASLVGSTVRATVDHATGFGLSGRAAE
ncbi:MAG: tRNA (N6-isopentenyl adenosine(37)-C2)-methylthiotransferase MiaB [Planctomycetota bacterium]